MVARLVTYADTSDATRQLGGKVTTWRKGDHLEERCPLGGKVAHLHDRLNGFVQESGDQADDNDVGFQRLASPEGSLRLWKAKIRVGLDVDPCRKTKKSSLMPLSRRRRASIANAQWLQALFAPTVANGAMFGLWKASKLKLCCLIARFARSRWPSKKMPTFPFAGAP
eukprot:scaffold2923_cov313-Pinguiococcus_pyrenoidosus.AAC.13